jgi:hypothetical protein
MNRNALRFNSNLPVEFMWKTHGGSAESGTGMTRDISFKGLFVSSNASPPVGSAIEAKVMLPSSVSSEIVIRMRATVLRVEATNTGEYASGFAAVTKKYALETYPEDQSEVLERS